MAHPKIKKTKTKHWVSVNVKVPSKVSVIFLASGGGGHLMRCTENKHCIYVTLPPKGLNPNLITQKPHHKSKPKSAKTTSPDYSKMSTSWTGKKWIRNCSSWKEMKTTKCNPGLGNWEKRRKYILKDIIRTTGKIWIWTK